MIEAGALDGVAAIFPSPDGRDLLVGWKADGSRRITSVQEVVFADERLTTRELFRYHEPETGGGEHVATPIGEATGDGRADPTGSAGDEHPARQRLTHGPARPAGPRGLYRFRS